MFLVTKTEAKMLVRALQTIAYSSMPPDEVKEYVDLERRLTEFAAPHSIDQYEVFPCADESDRWVILDVSREMPKQVGNMWSNERNARDACASLNQKARQAAKESAT